MTDLENSYRRRFDAALSPLALAVEGLLRDYFANELRIDRITARPKSVERFLAKAQTFENEKLKYSEPLHQIQDQVGARVITFYLSDVRKAAAVVEKYFRQIEARDVVPDSEVGVRLFWQALCAGGPNRTDRLLYRPSVDPRLF